MRRLLLDANLLFVFVIGSVDPKLLGTVKRVKEYRPGDFGLISEYVNRFNKVLLLPNTVTEASNLLNHTRGDRRQDCMEVLAQLTKAGGEEYVPSSLAVEQPEYAWLGVTDAALLCALTEDTSLLTADWALYGAAVSRGRNAEHFEVLRSA